MDTEALRWFQMVADGITVTEVGETEFLTQSGVSRALARLEADVGTPLLRKTGRVLRPTRAGAAFKTHVDALLHQLDDGLAAVEQLVDPESGTVALASQLSLGTWLVPSLLSSFRAQHPGIAFELRQVRDDLTTTLLAEGGVDLEITTVRHADRSIHWHRLLLEPLWLAVPRDHRLAARAQVGLSEAAHDDFIVLATASLLRRNSDALCQAAGFTPRVAFAGEDVPTIRGFVSAGLGVAIVPAVHDGATVGLGGRVRYLRLTDPGAEREIGLGWSAEHKLLPAAELFRAHIIARAAAGTLPGLASDGTATG